MPDPIITHRAKKPPLPLQTPIRFRFPIDFSERKLLLGVVDLILLNLSLLVVVGGNFDLWPLISQLWLWLVLLSALWLAIGLMLDIYHLPRTASAFHSMWAAGSTALLTAGSYWVIAFFTPLLPTPDLILFPLLSTLTVVNWRVLYATLFFQPAFHQTALIIGTGSRVSALLEAIAENSNLLGNPIRGTGYRILGLIAEAPAERHQEASVEGDDSEEVRVLGSPRDLIRLVKRLQPQELIIAPDKPLASDNDTFQALLDCRELGIQISSYSPLYERMTGRLPVEDLTENFDAALPITGAVSMRLYDLLRRIGDVVISLLALPLLMLVIPLIWLANQLTDPGTLFYRQERVGKSGKTFQIIKFRTMIMDAEKETGAVWASEKDPRITPVGRFLRQTRLDELPQLWNVLKGDMSLIGPRPERPHFVSQLSEDMPFYRTRHAVKPGLTGWAQVKYHYGASAEDALVKLQYDLYYIKHQGPYLDLLILLKTVLVVLGLQGR